MTEDEMVGWHHRLNGHGFGWTPGVGDGQEGLACCSSWGRNRTWLSDFTIILSRKNEKKKKKELLSDVEFGSQLGLYHLALKVTDLSQPIHLHRTLLFQFSSVQFSSSVVSDSVTPWTAAHQASLSITNSQSPPKPCPLSQWCHPTISSSVIPFSSHHQSFPASGSFLVSQFFWTA